MVRHPARAGHGKLKRFRQVHAVPPQDAPSLTSAMLRQLRPRAHDIRFGTAGAAPSCSGRFDGKEGHSAGGSLFAGCLCPVQYGGSLITVLGLSTIIRF
jgi:hypothetical protein